jgi:hypothetical protein
VDGGPEDGTDGRPEDAEAATQGDGADDDAGVVEQRRHAVPEEALLGEEDLAEGQRCGKEHLGDEHDAEERDIQVALLPREARGDPTGEGIGEDEQHDRPDAHDCDSEGQDRAAESIGDLRIGVGRSKIHEDRDEGSREAGLDEDVEQELGQDEGGVVGVELGAGSERLRKDPVAHEPHQVAAEDQGGEERRPRRHEASDARPGPTVWCPELSAGVSRHLCSRAVVRSCSTKER